MLVLALNICNWWISVAKSRFLDDGMAILICMFVLGDAHSTCVHILYTSFYGWLVGWLVDWLVG